MMNKVTVSNDEGMTLTLMRNNSPAWEGFYEHVDAMPPKISGFYEEHKKRLCDGLLSIRSDRLKELNRASNAQSDHEYLEIQSKSLSSQREKSDRLRDLLLEQADPELKEYFKGYSLSKWVGI